MMPRFGPPAGVSVEKILTSSHHHHPKGGGNKKGRPSKKDSGVRESKKRETELETQEEGEFHFWDGDLISIS